MKAELIDRWLVGKIHTISLNSFTANSLEAEPNCVEMITLIKRCRLGLQSIAGTCQVANKTGVSVSSHFIGLSKSLCQTGDNCAA